MEGSQAVVQVTVLSQSKPDPNQIMQRVALFRENGSQFMPGAESTILEKVYEGGLPSGGAQQFDAAGTMTPFLKDKDGSWMVLTIPEGIWHLEAIINVTAEVGVQAWSGMWKIAWPQDEDWEVTSPGSWVGIESQILTADVVIWPEGFDEVDQILKMSLPIEVGPGEEDTYILGLGSDTPGAVVTARQQNPSDQSFRALKVG